MLLNGTIHLACIQFEKVFQEDIPGVSKKYAELIERNLKVIASTINM